MDQFDQIRLLRMLLYTVVIVIMAWGTIQRFTQRRHAKKAELTHPATANDGADNASGSFAKDIAAAETLLVSAGKRFFKHWERKGVEPDLLNKFIDELSQKGIVDASLHDAINIRFRGYDQSRVLYVLFHLYNYLFMTWKDFPYERNKDSIEISAKACESAYVKTLDFLAPRTQGGLSTPEPGSADAFTEKLLTSKGTGSEGVNGLRKNDEVVQGAARELAESSGLKDKPQESKESARDLFGELVKLDELRKRGILTEDEFDLQKAKLLSQT